MEFGVHKQVAAGTKIRNPSLCKRRDWQGAGWASPQAESTWHFHCRHLDGVAELPRLGYVIYTHCLPVGH